MQQRSPIALGCSRDRGNRPRAGSARIVIGVLSLGAVLVWGCSDRTASEGGSGAGGAAPTGATSTGSTSKPDLLPICKSFCSRYQSCAPVLDCMSGCLSSAFVGCENEYANDVVCLTGALQGCSVPPDKCVDEGNAYLACETPSNSVAASSSSASASVTAASSSATSGSTSSSSASTTAAGG